MMDNFAFTGSQTKSTNNVINGTLGGVATAVTGSFIGVGIMVASPLKGTVDGYGYQGPIGGIVGLAVGATIGSLAGSLVILGSTYSCVVQFTAGLIRTPGWVGAVATGKEWDRDVEEWVTYSLRQDVKRTFQLNDATTERAMNGEDVRSESQARPSQGRLIKDLAFYQALGVPPTATKAEIKKAYYSKARECHPDKNPNDPTASTRFQALGEAYLVLSDDEKRFTYDSNGKQDMPPQAADPSAVFAMIFGSEHFEPILGELWIAPILSTFNLSQGEKGQPDLKQRKREVYCALQLLNKLNVFTSGHEELFISNCHSEVKLLSESPLGAALLGLIGGVYIDRVNSDSSTMQAVLISARNSGATLSTVFSLLQVATLAFAASTAPGPTFKPGTDEKKIEEEKKAHAQRALRDSMRHIVSMMWLVTKLDVASTVDNICYKLLHDTDADSDLVAKRRQALLTLGNIYLQASKDPASGLEDLALRMCAQCS